MFALMRAFKGVEKNRRSPDAISPEGTRQSVARHGSAGKDFTQIESRRDDTMASSHPPSLAPEVLFSRKRMGFKRVEKNRRSPDAISPEGTGQSVARHGSAGKDFKQIESRRDGTMESSHG